MQTLRGKYRECGAHSLQREGSLHAKGQSTPHQSLQHCTETTCPEKDGATLPCSPGSLPSTLSACAAATLTHTKTLPCPLAQSIPCQKPGRAQERCTQCSNTEYISIPYSLMLLQFLMVNCFPFYFRIRIFWFHSEWGKDCGFIGLWVFLFVVCCHFLFFFFNWLT